MDSPQSDNIIYWWMSYITFLCYILNWVEFTVLSEWIFNVCFWNKRLNLFSIVYWQVLSVWALIKHWNKFPNNKTDKDEKAWKLFHFLAKLLKTSHQDPLLPLSSAPAHHQQAVVCGAAVDTGCNLLGQTGNVVIPSTGTWCSTVAM